MHCGVLAPQRLFWTMYRPFWIGRVPYWSHTTSAWAAGAATTTAAIDPARRTPVAASARSVDLIMGAPWGRGREVWERSHRE
jgi:hypothetical protein